jgi:hypothetical protein
MNTLEDQYSNNRASDIKEFLTSYKYSDIRNLYKSNFETIYNLIEKFGHKHSVEDIADIADQFLKKSIFDNHLLLKQVNKAIKHRDLTLDDLL